MSTLAALDGVKFPVQVGVSILGSLLLYLGPMGPLLLSMLHFNIPYIERVLRDVDGHDAGDGLGGDDERYIDLPKFDVPGMEEALAEANAQIAREATPEPPTPPDPAPPTSDLTPPVPPTDVPAQTANDAKTKPEPQASPEAKPGGHQAVAGAATGADTHGNPDKSTWRNQKTDGGNGGRGKPAACEADDPRVRTVGDVTEVDRAAVDYYAKNLAELSALGDAGVHRNVEGRVDGFRVGLGRCGLLYEAGFRNGDVVHAVNDVPIYNVVDAARAYAKLRSADEFQVRVTRKRALVTLKFRVV